MMYNVRVTWSPCHVTRLQGRKKEFYFSTVYWYFENVAISKLYIR